ncbi:hypothetical protein BOTBODRAFT_432425 [Botryobasidium botryosum FD-172 SS1]|uniref:Uncharacterized protein n=1 Tax=Botryobasidium botryosum (strain FD-172 SS1) TaxID=930990 RepID=A0A067MB73_BOTB1|nr:hypothetical protein BOTBODRAFT_432425 [Botryobasidium botryosum FD-172 SS1]
MLPSSTTTDSPASSSRSLSRIGSVQRNWSEETPTLSTSGSTPTPSQETVISWPSSPELVKPVVAAPKKLSRMDAIRAALMEDPTTEVPPPAAPIASASSSSKRPSPSEDDGAQQPRKKRTLPWTTAHVDLKESRRERLASVPLKEVYPLAPPGQAPKVAPDPASSSSSSSPKFTAVLAASSAINIKQRVLLSVEQQQILQLVQGGKNVFFTGSAGTHTPQLSSP